MMFSSSKIDRWHRHYKQNGFIPYRVIALILLCVAMNSLVFSSSKAAEFAEHEIKAVFLYNFPNFIRWPDISFKNDNDAFVYCALDAGDAVIKTLSTLIEGEDVQGRAIKLLAPVLKSEIDHCQILYIGIDSFYSREDWVTSFIQQRLSIPVLTVSDLNEFSRMGGIIELAEQKGKIIPVINTDRLKQSGLKASSKLLRMAKRVKK